MANSDLKFNIELDKKAYDYFNREAPQLLEQARKNVVEAAGKVWADEAKDITSTEKHVQTGLYLNSIGYVTGSPATQSDVVHELEEQRSKTVLKTGSAVDYAASLEKRYAIMARALDVAEPRMKTVAKAQVKKTLRI